MPYFTMLKNSSKNSCIRIRISGYTTYIQNTFSYVCFIHSYINWQNYVSYRPTNIFVYKDGIKVILQRLYTCYLSVRQNRAANMDARLPRRAELDRSRSLEEDRRSWWECIGDHCEERLRSRPYYSLHLSVARHLWPAFSRSLSSVISSQQ